MQVATGTVVNGKIVVEGADLPEGSAVTVLSPGAAEAFRLTGSQEDELLEALAQIDRGESLTLEELLASLRNRR